MHVCVAGNGASDAGAMTVAGRKEAGAEQAVIATGTTSSQENKENNTG